MRKQSFDEQLARLQSIAREPLSDAVVDVLRQALNGSQNMLAALAAEIAGHRRIADLAPDMIEAFGRFMTVPDKGCQAKTAIVNALSRLEYDADVVCLRGIKHIQMEPAFGGQVDVAADLRAECAVMLANMRHPQAAIELTNLLVDKEMNPRRAAIKALAHLGTDGAEMVIRLKALVGDEEHEILGECFTALLSLSPSTAMDFVGRFVNPSKPAVAEQAALALGQTREAAAFEILRQHWEDDPDPSFRRLLLLPISLVRRDEAFAFLLDVVESSGPKLAAAALSALGIYAEDRSRLRIRDAVERRDDPLVSEAFAREFGPVD